MTTLTPRILKNILTVKTNVPRGSSLLVQRQQKKMAATIDTDRTDVYVAINQVFICIEFGHYTPNYADMNVGANVHVHTIGVSIGHSQRLQHC